MPDFDTELPAESAQDTAHVIADVIADAGFSVTTVPCEPGEAPRFTTDIPAADKPLDLKELTVVALFLIARLPGPSAKNLPASALLCLSSGTHAKATAFALRDLLKNEGGQ